MRKYIATSSLNLENILSTESISPYSFYKMRSFGYQNFVQLDILKNIDCILLFSEIPYFYIEDSQRENNPMIIQIDDDQQLSDIKEIGAFSNCKIYAYTKTIHINPVSAAFLFFTDKARILSYQNCLDSKMCKLVDYFKLQSINPSYFKLEDLVNNIKSSLYSNPNLVHEDNQYNRIKGFIYGYFIGKIKSISSNTAKMLTIQKRIYDIVASIKNNDGQGSTNLQKELINLDKEYTTLDPNIIRSKELWNKEIEKYGLIVDNLNKFLRDYNMESYCKHSFCNRKGITLRQVLSEYQPWELEEYSNKMLSHIHSLMAHDNKNAKEKLDLCSCMDVNPDYSLAMMTIEDAQNTLFNKILSHIVWNNIIPNLDSLRVHRFEIVTNIVQIISQIIENEGKEWKGSAEQLYFHHLRQNIKDFTPFNLLEIDNVVLQSLAAFLLKGEDFNALIDYLESTAMPAYQYAIALWGATLGYIQIPRSIIASSMNNDDFMKLYKDAYKLMHRKELNNLSMVSIPINKVVDSSLNWGKEVEVIINKHPRIKISDEDQQIIDRAKQEASNSVDFIIILANKMKKLTSGIFPHLQRKLYPNFKQVSQGNRQSKTYSSLLQNDLFNSAVKRSIIDDDNAKFEIRKCTTLKEYTGEIENLFIEFQKKYRKGGYYYSDPHKYKRNNEDFIDHFCKWCLSKKNKDSIPWSQENSRRIDELKKLLLSVYHD
ncbi:hypothetical protein [Bacteroides sp. An19]|uniref:hypothetical protein n=1 Tax=Bacteroides sp. An19 TaxID=1965580 RepID=UPI000B37A9E8|nr:hypothetical protein [Bacteroides sp. An19]OUP34609.1 hypothetical protein B5F25_05180 [Bacteroides sp. An19]